MRKEDIHFSKIPDAPGVYFFKRRAETLYIGKATSLRERVRSYFSADIMDTRGPRIVRMLAEADGLEWREAGSVLEALILEAALIRRERPFFNAKEKDDRSYKYVVITDEEFPRILTVRGRRIAEGHELPPVASTFGPFPKGTELRDALKIVRKIFPYRDSCRPHSGKKCFNAEIGLCPGVCAGMVSAKEYKKIVRRIRLLFEGKKRFLILELERDMRRTARKERFEEAAGLRRQIAALLHIQDVALMKRRDDGVFISVPTEKAFRIEAYDVAHLFGKERVGVMVAISDGEPDKERYRKFILSQQDVIDDIGALKEILRRRFSHIEWPFPDLVVVDGGAAQKNAAEKTLTGLGIAIPVAAVVKDERHKPKGILGELRGKKGAILLANSESHRFALSFHRARREKIL